MVDRSIARELAKKAIERGDRNSWFEELYQLGETRPEVVTWGDKKANPHLVTWAERKKLSGRGKRALVIGCGYGDDAEWLSHRDFEVTAFDIAPTAISAARKRFPSSRVHYLVADILGPHPEWRGVFDFVFEAYTLQMLTGDDRIRATRAIASTVKDTLLVVTRGRDDSEDVGLIPWPLTLSDLSNFQDPKFGLIQSSIEDFNDDETLPVRRFRVEYSKR